MKLVNIVLKNYRGIKDETKIRVNNFCCIVGKMMLVNLQFLRLLMLS